MSHHIVEEISIGDSEYTIVVTYNHNYNKNAPITIYINQQQNQLMGDYIYTIQDSSTFINSVDESEQLRSLNQQLASKYKVPIYLNINTTGKFSNVDMFQTITGLINREEQQSNIQIRE
ncbi:hypothetical protein CANMA_003596 [Candida margitis]|uniref:uncharacterized protein n=1 Tax=Candida margitis TaxID=1775924 RepID=UPI0022273AC7|nr:uncharacterized protein CANMA_003596 [Candida margitis]KAI5963430.1 hypothetical protein CANMA_003596 [Candida margitis]